MSWSYKNSKHELSLNIKAAKHRNKLSQTLKGTFKNDETLMLPWQTTNKPDKARIIQNKIKAKRRIRVILTYNSPGKIIKYLQSNVETVRYCKNKYCNEISPWQRLCPELLHQSWQVLHGDLHSPFLFV